MNDPIRIAAPVILSLLIFVGCSADGEPEVVDQSYINSEKYRRFDQRSVEERSSRSDEKSAFENVMKQLLRAASPEELSLPMEVDSLALERYERLAPKMELTQSMLNEPAEMDYEYYPLGKTEMNGMYVLLFVIRKPSVYYDKELAVATFNDSLIEVRSVGAFNKTLSQRVQSTVRINPPFEIVSEIERWAKYPVPQQHTTTYRYTINGRGEIEEEVLAGGDGN